MKEENEEYLEAAKNGDIVEVADALGDMMYILCGTIIEHGMQHIIEEVFDEIHRSNLSKLDENGNPIYREDGKVIKGPDYFPPNLKQFLQKKNNCFKKGEIIKRLPESELLMGLKEELDILKAKKGN